MPQQISETSDRHRSKDVVSDTEERAERTWPQPDAMPALKELCHEIYRNSEGTATRLSETLKQPLKKLKEDVTNIANTKGRPDGRTWRKIETDCIFQWKPVSLKVFESIFFLFVTIDIAWENNKFCRSQIVAQVSWRIRMRNRHYKQNTLHSIDTASPLESLERVSIH